MKGQNRAAKEDRFRRHGHHHIPIRAIHHQTAVIILRGAKRINPDKNQRKSLLKGTYTDRQVKKEEQLLQIGIMRLIINNNSSSWGLTLTLEIKIRI